jgi:hypothetical protein
MTELVCIKTPPNFAKNAKCTINHGLKFGDEVILDKWFKFPKHGMGYIVIKNNQRFRDKTGQEIYFSKDYFEFKEDIDNISLDELNVETISK